MAATAANSLHDQCISFALPIQDVHATIEKASGLHSNFKGSMHPMQETLMFSAPQLPLIMYGVPFYQEMVPGKELAAGRRLNPEHK